METQQFQKSLDLSLPVFMLQKYFLLGWRHKEDQGQGGLGLEGRVKKDER